MRQKIYYYIEGGKRELLPLSRTAGDGSTLILDKLSQPEPCMIARFGSVELNTIIKSMAHTRLGGLGRFAVRKWRGRDVLDEKVAEGISVNAGFFPATASNILKFTDLMIEAMSSLDVLGSWVEGENLVRKYFESADLVPLRSLEPYYHETPWSKVLEGKKVLVVHPYTHTIQEQYKKYNLLFEDQNVLPKFDLKVVKAIQSIGGESVPYKNWFEALEHMQNEIANVDFDIAIIGCGAYGFPLAAYVKSLGKKAVHLGGATQILFGVKGRRWDDHEYISTLYNEHWVRPSLDETPLSAGSVEDGCYW